MKNNKKQQRSCPGQRWCDVRGQFWRTSLNRVSVVCGERSTNDTANSRLKCFLDSIIKKKNPFVTVVFRRLLQTSCL